MYHFDSNINLWSRAHMWTSMQVGDSVGVLNAGKVGKLDYTSAFHTARLFFHTITEQMR